jgi:hypothetical protein
MDRAGTGTCLGLGLPDFTAKILACTDYATRTNKMLCYFVQADHHGDMYNRTFTPIGVNV